MAEKEQKKSEEKDKNEYIRLYDAKMQEIRKEIELLESKLEAAGAETRLELKQKIEELQSKRDHMKQEIEKIKAAGEHAWRDITGQLDIVFDEIKLSLKKLKNSL